VAPQSLICRTAASALLAAFPHIPLAFSPYSPIFCCAVKLARCLLLKTLFPVNLAD